MRDFGIIKGLVQKFDTNDTRGSDSYWGFEKMFRDYLNRLNVSFFSSCCPNANKSGLLPVGFSSTTLSLSYFDPTSGTQISIGDAQSVSSLTAHSGGGQGSATQLAQGFNEVTVVAAGGDSVKLPLAAEGLTVFVKNDGANAMDVFPGSADTIDDGTVNVAVSIKPGVSASFRAVSAVNWESSIQGNQATTSYLGTISELVTGAGITASQSVIQKHSTFAVNISATVAAASFAIGYFTSTSAAPVTLTLDTATAIATAIGAVQGTMIDFYVDNTAGANTVTVALGAGIVAATPVITGGGTLTISTANGIGVFRLVFSSATAAKLFRIG